MKSLFRYLVVHPLLALLLVVVLLVAGVAVLSLTQVGTGLLVQGSERFVPALKLDGVRGTLVEQLKADSLVWEQDGIKVDAQQVTFKPAISYSLPLHISINQLTAQRLVIDLPPSKDTPYEPIVVPDLQLPVEAELDNIALDELVINQGAMSYVIQDAVLNARTDGGWLYLENLTGRLAGDLRTIDVSAKGDMGLKQPHPLNLSVDVDSSSDVLGAGALKLEAAGELQNYQVSLDGDWQYQDYPVYQVSASGKGTFEGIELDKVALQGEAGDVELLGKLLWLPEPEWALKGTAEAIRPAFFAPDVTGDLDVVLATTGVLKKEEGPDLKLQVSKLEGTLRDYPLLATLSADLKGKDLILHDLDALVGDNRLTAQGLADEQLSINWKLDAPRLDQFHPEVSGALQGRGALSGKIDGSRFALNIQSLDGEVMDYPLSARGGLTLNDQVLAAKQLELDVGDNHVTLDGVADEATGIDWRLDARSLEQLHPELLGDLKGAGNAKGLLDGSRLALQVDRLQGTVRDYPVEARGGLRLENQLLTADDVSVDVGENRIRLDGKTDEDSGIDWVIDAPQLVILHPELSGHLKGQGNAKGVLDGSRLTVKVDALSGQIKEYPIKAQGEVKRVDQVISARKFQLAVGKNKVRLDGVADEATGIDWVLDAPELATLHPALSGKLQGNGNAKGLLDGSRLALQVDHLSGEVKGFPVKSSGGFRVKDQLISADDFRVDVGKNKVRLDGVADEATGIDWVIDAPQLAELHPELTGELKGKGNAKGLLDGSRAEVRIEQLEGRIKDYPIQAKGSIRLVEQAVSADDFQLAVGKNRVRLSGVADEATGINWQLDAPELAKLHPDVPGSLKGSGNVKGLIDGSRFNLHIAQLEGRVRHFPVNAKGGVSMRNQQLSVDRLQLAMGANTAQLNGVVDERHGVNWSLNAPNLSQIDPSLEGNVAGKGNIRGKLDGSSLVASIDQLSGRVMDYPVNGSGGVQYRNGVLSADDLRLNVGANAVRVNGVVDEKTGLSWSLDAQKLVQLHPSLDGQLKGRGMARGSLDGKLVTMNLADLEGRVRGYPLKATGTVQLRDRKLLVANDVRLNVGANAVRVSGQLDENKGLNWQLDAQNLKQFHPELDGQLRGNGNLRGVLDGSRFALKVNTLEGRVKQYPVRVSGEISGKDQVFTARNVLASVGQNTLKLDGSAGDALGLNWQLDARNIAQVVPDIKGSARGHGKLTGKLDGSQLNLQIASLQGQVDGRPLNAKGVVSMQGKKINVSNLQVNAGSNLVSLNGQASEPLNLSWKINGRNLAQAWPGLAGNIQGEGTVRGSTRLPQVQGYLKGSNVRYQDMAVQALDVNITQKGPLYDVKGTLRNVRRGENVLTFADIKGQGTLEKHTVTVAAVHKDGKLNLNASGGLRGKQWNGAVHSLGLRDTVAGDWQLTAPVKISASPQSVTLTSACLANRQNARLCSQGGWTQQAGATAKGQLQQVPLSMARSFLPNSIQLPGRVNADYELQQRGGRPFGRVNVQLPDNTISIRAGNKTETFRYSNARASVVLNDRNATVDAQFDVQGHGQLKTTGTVILSPENQQHRVDLRTTVNVPSITWMERFSPQVSALKGQITGDVRVTGLLNKPKVTGVARLQNGSLYLPETGSKIDDINLTAQAVNADQLAIKGTLRAGGGELTANGSLQLARLPDWSGNVRIQGSNLLLMNSHEIQAKVSPDLNIVATPQAVKITGKVLIPETTISLRELPSTASVRSDDIVIVGRGGRPLKGNKVVIAEDSGKPLFIQPNVVVELGNRVSFSGFGLDARMTGKMRMLRNRQGIVAEGALNVVDGVYKAYGQNLKIERGRLLFNGPVENPGLDVRAIRAIEGDITVGIELGGTVKTPESTLFSNPVQTQTDTLSYLLTGRSISNVGSGDSQLLNQAITGLGVAGGESLAQKLGGQLGLDDVGLKARDGDYKQSELSLGKRLGPKLYVKYIVGLFDSLQKVAVTYQLNRHLEVEATSGVNQSVDLIYKIDSDTGPFSW